MTILCCVFLMKNRNKHLSGSFIKESLILLYNSFANDFMLLLPEVTFDLRISVLKTAVQSGTKVMKV